MRRLWIVVVMACCGGAWGQQGEKYQMDIVKGGVVCKVAIPDAVVTGAGSPALATELREILSNDLNFSGVLECLETRQFIEETHAADVQLGKINFAEWQRIQADFLIKMTCEARGNDLMIEAILYYCANGKDIVGRRYKGEPGLKRNMVHRFADEVVLYLTGKVGCACSKIAFVSDATGHRELYLMDYDGENLLQLTKNKSLVMAPAWSPDGQTLLMTTYHMGDYPALFQMNANGTGFRKIATAGSLSVASSWHPKLPLIAATLNAEANPEIYTIDLKTNTRRKLTDSPGVDISPSWSPDGQQIAFCSDRSAKPQIYIMDADGGNERRLSTEGGYNCSPDWCPVSDWIAYCSLRGKFDICALKADGSAQSCLTEGYGNNEDPSWSPDGRHVIFTSTRSGRRTLYCVTVASMPDGLRAVKIRTLPCGTGEITTPAWSPRLAR